MSLPEAGILGAEGGYPSSFLSICFIILQSNSLPYAMYLTVISVPQLNIISGDDLFSQQIFSPDPYPTLQSTQNVLPCRTQITFQIYYYFTQLTWAKPS